MSKPTTKTSKILKPNRVVILTAGRHAGKKGIVVTSTENAEKNRIYGHSLIVGLDQCPKKIKKSFSLKKKERNSKIKGFIKIVNNNHLMPTRYTLDIELKGAITMDSLENATKRKQCRDLLATKFTEKYLNGKNKWFFTPLAF